MGEEKKNDPQWKPNEMEPNVATLVTLQTAKPIKSGTGQYGDWHLWLVSVTDSKVFADKGKTEQLGYTGDAIVFPSDKLHERFLELTNGTQEGVEIEVKLVPKKGKLGFFTTFEANLVGEGSTPPNNLTNGEYSFLGDFRKFVASGTLNGTEEEFLDFGKSDVYNLDEPTLKKLWTVFKEE